MINYTVVLFREGEDMGIEADNVEVLEDSETQMVITATFNLAVPDLAAEGEPIEPLEIEVISDGQGLIEVKKIEAVGTAEGEIVGHSGRPSELESD